MQFQRLEDLRLDADKTQAEIAEVLHCKREVYRRYERVFTRYRLGRSSNWRSIMEQRQIISLA